MIKIPTFSFLFLPFLANQTSQTHKPKTKQIQYSPNLEYKPRIGPRRAWDECRSQLFKLRSDWNLESEGVGGVPWIGVGGGWGTDWEWRYKEGLGAAARSGQGDGSEERERKLRDYGRDGTGVWGRES